MKPSLHGLAGFLATLFLTSFSSVQGAAAQAATNPPTAASANSCCICVADLSWDVRYNTAICEDWFKQAKRKSGCAHHFIVNKVDETGRERFPSGTSCTNIQVYGVFHGKSNETRVPFQLAAAAAKAFNAKKVCYDGVTCLVFDNIKDVEACARTLSRAGGCRYEITGNQNIGLSSAGGFFCGPRETEEAGSKLTALIDGLSVQLHYAPCTGKGDECVYLSKISEDYPLSKNDPNAKWCTHRGAIVEQRCCISEWMKQQMKFEKSGYGKWSAPAAGCP
jgi:hypothetical protein